MNRINRVHEDNIVPINMINAVMLKKRNNLADNPILIRVVHKIYDFRKSVDAHNRKHPRSMTFILFLQPCVNLSRDLSF